MVKGIIWNYRQGRHTQNNKHMIIIVDKVTKKQDAEKLKGKEVVWKSPAGKELKGKVASFHGNKGAIRVIFETGLPGQSIGTEVEIK